MHKRYRGARAVGHIRNPSGQKLGERAVPLEHALGFARAPEVQRQARLAVAPLRLDRAHDPAPWNRAAGVELVTGIRRHLEAEPEPRPVPEIVAGEIDVLQRIRRNPSGCGESRCGCCRCRRTGPRSAGRGRRLAPVGRDRLPAVLAFKSAADHEFEAQLERKVGARAVQVAAHGVERKRRRARGQMRRGIEVPEIDVDVIPVAPVEVQRLVGLGIGIGAAHVVAVIDQHVLPVDDVAADQPLHARVQADHRQRVIAALDERLRAAGVADHHAARDYALVRQRVVGRADQRDALADDARLIRGRLLVALVVA